MKNQSVLGTLISVLTDAVNHSQCWSTATDASVRMLEKVTKGRVFI